MNKNLLIGLGVLLAVVVVGFYFIKSPKLNYNFGSSPSTSVVPSASAIPGGPIKEISVSAKDYSYTPSTITVKKGETVKINFTNDGYTAHNFTISDLNVATKTVGRGESDSVTFTPEATGTYTFFCSVDSHEELGLKGTFVVQ